MIMSCQPRWSREVRQAFLWYNTADSFANKLYQWKQGFSHRLLLRCRSKQDQDWLLGCSCPVQKNRMGFFKKSCYYSILSHSTEKSCYCKKWMIHENRAVDNSNEQYIPFILYNLIETLTALLNIFCVVKISLDLVQTMWVYYKMHS